MESPRIAIATVNKPVKPQSPTLALKLDNSLYLNITNDCTCKCSYCFRFHPEYVEGCNFHLNSQPNATELITLTDKPYQYREIVFWGLGEPTLRFGIIKHICQWVKERRGKTRLITNGHGNLIHKRNIVPEMKGLIDSISITLNAPTKESYYKICQPQFGQDTFDHVLEFIKQSIYYIPSVEVTALKLPGVDYLKTIEIISNLDATVRLRELGKLD